MVVSDCIIDLQNLAETLQALKPSSRREHAKRPSLLCRQLRTPWPQPSLIGMSACNLRVRLRRALKSFDKVLSRLFLGCRAHGFGFCGVR